MDVFQHFSCHTVLPIKINDVRDHVLEAGVVDVIAFSEVSIDAGIIGGICRVYTEKPAYSSERTVAQIYFAGGLQLPERRMIVCKELLHLLDGHEETAQTREEVDRLIEEIVLPLDVRGSLPSVSDHLGILRALTILLPRDSLDILRPKVAGGQLSAEDIAKIALIPESYVRVALSPAWERVVESIR